MIAALLANIHRDDKKRPQPFMPEDFFPRLTADAPKPVERQSWQQMLATVEMLNVAFGGKDLRKKKKALTA